MTWSSRSVQRSVRTSPGVRAMGSEKRTVRPYIGVGAIGRSLDHVRLVVGGDKVEKGGRVSIPASTYLVAPVTLRLSGSVEGPGLPERLLAGLEVAEVRTRGEADPVG